MAATHHNNFDLLRLLFAVFVLITHSYPISGAVECDILCQYSSGQAQLSNIGLQGFFIISGYLVYQSLLRSHSIAHYYRKRVLRIFPALIVVLVLTVFLGALVYESANVPYWKNIHAYTYIPRNLSLLFIQYEIPGVFMDQPLQGVINGSLWTLVYEFLMYILLSGFFFFKRKSGVIVSTLTLVLLCLFVLNVFYGDELGHFGRWIQSGYIMNFGFMFAAGALLAVLQYRQWCKYHKLLLIVSCIVLLCSLFLPFHYAIMQYLVLPFIVIGTGIKATPIISKISHKVGDLSYGLYIYAFVVQQTLICFFHLNYWQLMLAALPVTCILAFASWHLVEKKALRFK